MSHLLELGAGAVVATIALAFATRIPAVQSLDDEVEQLAGRARRRGFVYRAALVGTLPGEPYMHPALGALSAALISASHTEPVSHMLPRVLIPLAAASIGAILAHHAVKLVYHRPRPAIALSRGKTESAFPSGHTADATAVLLTGALLLLREGVAPLGIVLPIALVLALGTGVSRVLLGWHWATDVLGGWLTGIAVAAGTAGLYEILLRIS